jgi:prepilin-type N-terminal cleavage/methylation domain-containing protein
MLGVIDLRRRQAGFTLTELSLVLLVIALLFGVVLKAQAMIQNAQVGRDIKTLQSFQAAYYLYRDRHGALPGEDPDKPGRFKTVLSSDAALEEGFFYDLKQSGLIYSAQPLPSIGAAYKATWGGSSGANYGLIAGQNQVCITQIDTALAGSIEARLDGSGYNDGTIEYTKNGSQLCMLMK